MENTNYDLLTNSELNQKYEELNRLFQNAQNLLKEQYLLMKQYSEEAIKIKNIIKKRGGKINNESHTN